MAVAAACVFLNVAFVFLLNRMALVLNAQAKVHLDKSILPFSSFLFTCLFFYVKMCSLYTLATAFATKVARDVFG